MHTSNTRCLLALLCLAAALLGSPATALAGDDHNHDAGPAAPTGPALPRFAAVSDAFELVGVVDGTQLTVYLDRFADNTPVQGAQVELELGGAKVALTERAAGELAGTLPQPLKTGLTPVTATVVVGAESDILAADVDVHADTHVAATASVPWRRYAAWAAGAVVLLGAAAVVMRRVAQRRGTVGVAA